jgi:hypothetical protein
MKYTCYGFDRVGNHDARLTREENIFLSILWIDHVGEKNAIPADHLAIIFARQQIGQDTAPEEIEMLLDLMTSTKGHRKQLDEWKRDVRSMHNHLLKRHEHIPILSKAGHGGGYWVAKSEEELHAFYESFRKRGLTSLVKAARGKKAVLVEMVRQLSFDFELRDRTALEPVRPGSDVSMPVEVVDQFLERMLSDPERFSGDLQRLSKKFGNVLFSKAQASAMKSKIRELNELAAGL